MSRMRFVDITGADWFDIGRSLAEAVADKSSFAYRFDREIYSDENDIKDLWRKGLGPKAKSSMRTATPHAYALCEGFDTIFSSKGEGFSVWELLTLYEVDMFLHEFHYKCEHCKHRIMVSPRYVCADCAPLSASDESPAMSTRRTKRIKRRNVSVCSTCQREHSKCEHCSTDLTPTSVLHETSGLGIANKSGCTGFGYRDESGTFCGQTLEMATDTYNYGRFDTIYRLCNKNTGVSVLVYDVGCILSPFGINSKKLGLCVFNLYNSDYRLPPYGTDEVRVPMAALQWEILLRGSADVTETLDFLRGANGGIPTFTSASFIVAAAGKCSVIEISANEHWKPSDIDDANQDNQPAILTSRRERNSEWIVRANNCLAGSSLVASESLPPNISSRERQADLQKSFQNLSGAGPDVEWAKTALSTTTIQTEYCLGTIVMEPAKARLHVRFRAGTRISSTLKDGGKWDEFSI